MATAVKQKLVLIPFDGIESFRVVEEDIASEGEYILVGRDGRLVGYDISAIIPEPDPINPKISQYHMSIENGQGKGWTHRIVGVADNPYALNAVARRVHNSEHYLLAISGHGWEIIGNQYGGDLTVRTGGYTDTEDGKWHVTKNTAYEFECAYQLYPNCIYRGEIDILPIEDLMTRKES